ncbi:hypothetical protein PL373_11000 [Tenacibaculum maritimum]|nr:hypothetical protein [Tenacibaculum maritimum]MDB0601609.1 hypothetical protein [Tenacibaculum maritimum]MDB0601624.1 hypothetical protein [Tenacibaculum maritimum]MDB0601667.1 hypothetical protein [Tenacibaculum maritimum]MDB0612854.1 hypothetical protein [Tenacibaculum maritimum]
MTQSEKIKRGLRRNTLLRYEAILNTYHEALKENRYIKPGEVYKDYIYPRYLISRTTYYKILATPVKKELEKLNALI